MNIFVSDGKVLSQDRAFNYGDGIFTTTHVQHGKIQLFDFHLSRLAHDASVLNIALDMKALSDAMVKTAKAESRQSFVLKVHVSAGEGGRGYARDKANPALIRLMCFPYPQHYEPLREKGADLICAQTPLSIQPLLAGVKHLNRLEQVLIKRELETANADDALVLDTQHHIVEASAGNVFFKNNQGWHTPILDGSGVNGVVRQFLLSHFRDDRSIEITEARYSMEALIGGDCLVVTNALMGVMPVKSLTLENGNKLTFDTSHSQVLADALLTKYREEDARFS